MPSHSATLRHSNPTRLRDVTGRPGRITAAAAGDPLKLDKFGNASYGNA